MTKSANRPDDKESMCNSRQHHKGKWVRFGIGRLFLGALVVMVLWNALFPDLFGWASIGYWQAFGLLLLSRFLIGWPIALIAWKRHAPKAKSWRDEFAARMQAKCDASKRQRAQRDEETERFRDSFTSGKWNVNIVDVEEESEQKDTGEEGQASDDSPDKQPPTA